MSVIQPPFDNVLVRKAVHLALDRELWKDFRRVIVRGEVLEGTSAAFWVPPRHTVGDTRRGAIDVAWISTAEG